MGVNLTDAQKNNLRKMVKDNVPALEIERRTGHSLQTIYRYMKYKHDKKVTSTHYYFTRSNIDEKFIEGSF